MSPPLLGVEGKYRGNDSVVAASASMDCISQNGSGLKEHNYLRLSDCSLEDSSRVSSVTQTIVSGNKRGFSDTVDRCSEMKSCVYTDGKWMLHGAGSDSRTSQSVGQGKFPGNVGVNVVVTSRPSGAQRSVTKEVSSRGLQEPPHAANGTSHNEIKASNNISGTALAANAQVVGWPPIRSFRKNTLATTSKNNDEVDGKPGPGTVLFFVKVSMDGAPYLRKVDLKLYYIYEELSSALEKMFGCFTIGQCGSLGDPGKDMLSESKLSDLLHGSENVLAYDDKDARVSEQMGEIRSAVKMGQLEAEKKHDDIIDEMLAMLNAKAEASRLKEVEQEVGKDVDEEQ
ncbi:Auxin-responsive protein IAA9 [Camellia lanceoleosa]|uniref:Auxin-responsive protein IAA9 n=1 Tax=Camellia lanceoleosa TaxID=1840588 RepID=A0ACC0I0U9_9ERIC|nr:Auxin-responsive protein IAA9 [Camellia lanceoleosa]